MLKPYIALHNGLLNGKCYKNFLDPIRVANHDVNAVCLNANESIQHHCGFTEEYIEGPLQSKFIFNLLWINVGY